MCASLLSLSFPFHWRYKYCDVWIYVGLCGWDVGATGKTWCARQDSNL